MKRQGDIDPEFFGYVRNIENSLMDDGFSATQAKNLTKAYLVAIEKFFVRGVFSRTVAKDIANSASMFSKYARRST
jgi:hypothetical protein